MRLHRSPKANLVLTTRQLNFPREGDPRKRERARWKWNAFYDLVSEVTHHLFCPVQFFKSKSPNSGLLSRKEILVSPFSGEDYEMLYGHIVKYATSYHNLT